MSLLGFGLWPGLDVPVAHADFTFGEPLNLQSTNPLLLNSVNLNSVNEMIDCFSADGLEMYIESGDRPGYGQCDLWVCKRAAPEDEWGPPENLGPLVNGASDDNWASISGDGLDLYFMSTRPGGYGGWDIYVTKRATRTSPWGPATNLGSKVNSSDDDCQPSVPSDGLELYFASWRAGAGDIYVAGRATGNDPWSDSSNLGPAVNGPAEDCWTCISPDGLLLFVMSNRAGGYGGYDIWMARRAGRTAPWEPAANLGPTFNGPTWDGRPLVTPDGSALYFVTQSGGWMTAPILPIVDFNGDGKVDATDMDLLEINWGQSDPVGDVGPCPWGDGIVDEKDLKVLMESLMTPGPKASDVPYNVILSWIGPSFAESYDVYFGTSFDDVNNATRDDPCGVLVSEGQTETTYNPNGLLEFSQTYYWRVDGIEVVIGSLEPTIYRGSVLSFTTEAYAYPIQNITAAASSSGVGMGPEKTVDGSGLDENDGHSTNAKDMWQSKSKPPQWIQFEFDQVYTLHELWVWNSNSEFESFMSFGAKDVTIEYSPDGTTWMSLDGVPEFAKAPGTPGYTANTIVSFGGVSAKYVKLTINSTWGAAPAVGLSEVRFFHIPDRAYGSTP